MESGEDREGFDYPTLSRILESDPAYWRNPNKFRKKILSDVRKKARNGGTPFKAKLTRVERLKPHQILKQLRELLRKNASLAGKDQEHKRRCVASKIDQRVEVLKSRSGKDRRDILKDSFKRMERRGEDVPDYLEATKYLKSTEGRPLWRQKYKKRKK